MDTSLSPREDPKKTSVCSLLDFSSSPGSPCQTIFCSSEELREDIKPSSGDLSPPNDKSDNTLQLKHIPSLPSLPSPSSKASMTDSSLIDTSSSTIPSSSNEQQEIPHHPTESSPKRSAPTSTDRQESRLFAIKCGDSILSGGKTRHSFSINNNGFHLRFDFSQSTAEPPKCLIDAASCFEEGFRESLQQSINDIIRHPLPSTDTVGIFIPFSDISAINLTQLFPSNPAERDRLDTAHLNDQGPRSFIVTIFQITLNPFLNQIARRSGPITITEFERKAKENRTRTSKDCEASDTHRHVLNTPKSFSELVINFAASQNAERSVYAARLIDIIQKNPYQSSVIFDGFYMFETDIVWSMLVTLVETFHFSSSWTAKEHVKRTVKETLKQKSSSYNPTVLQNSSDHRGNDVLKRATIHLLDFVLIEMGRLPSVQTGQYPLNMIDPIVPYMLLFITSSDTTIQNKAASILHSVTSVPITECIPALSDVDVVTLQADLSLHGWSFSGSPQESFSTVSILIEHLSTFFTDADVSSPYVETVKLLIRIASSLLTSEEALFNLANCLPLTLLVTALTAAPPSHHLPILNIYLDFTETCPFSVEIQEPFLKRLLSVFPPDTNSDGSFLVTLLKFLTRLTFLSSLWGALFPCLSNSEPSSKITLCLLAIINDKRRYEARFDIQRKKVPKIAPLLLQDLDELTLSFLLSVLGQNADRSNGDRLEEDEAQRIVEKLLEIEQRPPLHTDTQETEKTATDGTTLSPLVDGKGEPGTSSRTGKSVNELVDVWRVMRLVVSSLAGSPSGLERLHVLYPLIFQRLKERGNSLLSKGKQAKQTREMLLPALVCVCSELTPLLQTVDCFPLVHLVSSFLISIRKPKNRRPKPRPKQRQEQSVNLDSIELPVSFALMKEFFLRVHVVTQGLDGYDITHHTIFPPSSTEHSSAGADCVISRPILLLEFFVDFEVKCIGVKEAALLQQNNPTTPDPIRRQLLLHLLSTMKQTNDFDPSAVCGVLLSFPRLPPSTILLIHSLRDVIIISRVHPRIRSYSTTFNTSLPVSAEGTCRLFSALLMRAVPNEADSEEIWRVVLREEGWEDMLNVILNQSLTEVGMKNGMNCTVTSSLFKPSTIPGDTEPTETIPPLRMPHQIRREPVPDLWERW
ncbi:hypothetical protein BLNAU_19678 [Blattamonas nauphoetae]|uniref:Uncharacterized protein n=1 Tax=Blattamonas nauphoetae TaxID=2049346 RepID=A0ABQ9X0X0_9EUKA|nr:hypothetical protein BLNAU_19678 [Blattamonas nauphoetae]